MTIYRSVFKPLFDVTVALVSLALLSPVLLLVGVVVRVFIGSPVIFRQKRPGMRGAIFTLLKFRTMTEERDGQGRLLPDGARLGRVGQLLRSTSVDELPELINVVRGEMSLVGPRPLLCQYLDRYSPQQARRHEVKPGITGWAQVNGRNALSWEQRFQLDVWYVDHVSLPLDMKILMMTVWKTLKREGVSQPGQVTATEFMGTK